MLLLGVTAVPRCLVAVAVSGGAGGHQVRGKHSLKGSTARRASPQAHPSPDGTPHPPRSQREGRQRGLQLGAHRVASSCPEAQQGPQVWWPCLEAGPASLTAPTESQLCPCALPRALAWSASLPRLGCLGGCTQGRPCSLAQGRDVGQRGNSEPGRGASLL